MTQKRFIDIVETLREQDEVIHNLYIKKVDLLDFVDPYQKVITELITELYGEQGYDWFSWFCFENDYGKKGLEAWDENKTPICYDVESLWSYLEKNRKL